MMEWKKREREGGEEKGKRKEREREESINQSINQQKIHRPRDSGMTLLKRLKGKHCQPRIIYLAKLSFRHEEKQKFSQTNRSDLARNAKLSSLS